MDAAAEGKVLVVVAGEDCAARLALLGAALTDRTWVFSAKPDMSRPRDPASLTRRDGRLVAKLGVDTVLTAGVLTDTRH